MDPSLFLAEDGIQASNIADHNAIGRYSRYDSWHDLVFLPEKQKCDIEQVTGFRRFFDGHQLTVRRIFYIGPYHKLSLFHKDSGYDPIPDASSDLSICDILDQKSF